MLDKILALEQDPRPERKKQLHQFLDFMGNYSWLIPNFTNKAGLLTDCLTKGEPDHITWTPARVVAFNALRCSLSDHLILHNPNFSLPFHLATDASGMGLRVVLSQECNGQGCPILFISQKFSPVERKYSTVEKEALAVIWAVGALHYYLLHNTFSLWVDHKHLKWIESMKE